MDWFNAMAVLVIPFALFGVFAAIGVYLVRTSKELGLRIVGYTVVVVFGLMAVTLPPYVYVSSNTPCYNPKGVKVPCDGTTAVLFVINPDMERAYISADYPTFDRVECYKDGVSVLCWPTQALR